MYNFVEEIPVDTCYAAKCDEWQDDLEGMAFLDF
jgi:hypothetical protein